MFNIKDNIYAVDGMLERSFKISDKRNGNIHSIHLLTQSSLFLINLSIQLRDIAQKNSHTGDIYKLSMLITNLQFIRSSIQNFELYNVCEMLNIDVNQYPIYENLKITN